MMSEKDLALNGGVKVIDTDGDGVIDAVHPNRHVNTRGSYSDFSCNYLLRVSLLIPKLKPNLLFKYTHPLWLIRDL